MLVAETADRVRIAALGAGEPMDVIA